MNESGKNNFLRLLCKTVGMTQPLEGGGDSNLVFLHDAKQNVEVPKGKVQCARTKKKKKKKKNFNVKMKGQNYADLLF
jgi:hypothetical protein